MSARGAEKGKQPAQSAGKGRTEGPEEVMGPRQAPTKVRCRCRAPTKVKGAVTGAEVARRRVNTERFTCTSHLNTEWFTEQVYLAVPKHVNSCPDL